MEDSQASTRARTLNWFVRGGTVRSADGREAPIDVDPVLVGRDPGAHLQVTDPEVSALHLGIGARSEEHTSELHSRLHLAYQLPLDKHTQFEVKRAHFGIGDRSEEHTSELQSRL